MLADKIGEGVTTHMRAIAKENPPLQGIIDRVDFNATTHGQPASQSSMPGIAAGIRPPWKTSLNSKLTSVPLRTISVLTTRIQETSCSRSGEHLDKHTAPKRILSHSISVPTTTTLVNQFEDIVVPLFEQVGTLLQMNQKLRTARDLLLRD